MIELLSGESIPSAERLDPEAVEVRDLAGSVNPLKARCERHRPERKRQSCQDQ